MNEAREFLLDEARQERGRFTNEERGVLALWKGLDTYTRECAPKYADPCAAIEMGVPQMFRAARAMLNYAPDTLRRGALDHAYAEMLRAWHVNPDTLEWEGE
jgi:hypothetical protein